MEGLTRCSHANLLNVLLLLHSFRKQSCSGSEGAFDSPRKTGLGPSPPRIVLMPPGRDAGILGQMLPSHPQCSLEVSQDLSPHGFIWNSLRFSFPEAYTRQTLP